MHKVKQLPPDITTLIFEAGPRILVLVEGDRDQTAFEEWYEERLDKLMFHAPGGSNGVVKRLKEVLDQSSQKRAYGIIDRDFRGNEEIEARLRDPDEHLFVLRRYAIENYLLEPEVLREELRVYYGQRSDVPNVITIKKDILQFCHSLRIMMACNWVLLEASKEYFAVGHDLTDRQTMVNLTAGKIGCDVGIAEARIAEKEVLIEPALATLDTAHAFINGKHLLHHCYEQYIVQVQRGLVKDHLFNLLVRTVKYFGVHPDIKAIIEDRILK